MIDTRFVDYNPQLRRQRLLHYDPLTDEFVLESKQDITDIIELNRAQYAATDERAPWGKWGAHVGRIPASEYWRLKREGVIDSDGEVQGEKELLKLLMDPDYRGFRTRPGRLI